VLAFFASNLERVFEMPDETSVGLAPYSTASKANRILAKLETKCRLRAELAKVQSELDLLIPQLSHGELVELQQAMVQAADAADRDVAELQAKVSEELELSNTTKAASVVISRVASAALAAEAERRVRRGVFPSTESLISEAVQRAFGR
jgi:hypothetical protein